MPSVFHFIDSYEREVLCDRSAGCIDERVCRSHRSVPVSRLLHHDGAVGRLHHCWDARAEQICLGVRSVAVLLEQSALALESYGCRGTLKNRIRVTDPSVALLKITSFPLALTDFLSILSLHIEVLPVIETITKEVLRTFVREYFLFYQPFTLCLWLHPPLSRLPILSTPCRLPLPRLRTSSAGHMVK